MTTATNARTVLDLFDRACAANPSRCALDIPGEPSVRLTYAELDLLARRVTAAVAPHAARDAVVAVALPRTDPLLYASVLGIMRAGAAYVAIDPAFPARQAAAILSDAGASALVATRSRAQEITDLGAGIALLSPEALASTAPAHAERFWLVDPLDGTREFAAGRDNFAVNIGLVVAGRAMLGAVALPSSASPHRRCIS
jgi:non-ribosomal peptide synthetase component F